MENDFTKRVSFQRLCFMLGMLEVWQIEEIKTLYESKHEFSNDILNVVMRDNLPGFVRAKDITYLKQCLNADSSEVINFMNLWLGTQYTGYPIDWYISVSEAMEITGYGRNQLNIYAREGVIPFMHEVKTGNKIGIRLFPKAIVSTMKKEGK